ncbi:MAG: MerR family transcriptional regulator [Candidatus Babeliaceae bacterium]|jgi:DNA-binding transcriptional MerR regulator
MKMEKRKFRIGELADLLAVEKFVVRFWEKEFHFRAQRSEGGQRFYDEKDLKKFSLIKELLYEKGFTIAGAKKFLKDQGKKAVTSDIIASQITNMDQEAKVSENNDNSDVEDCGQDLAARIEQQIIDLQRKLIKLRELL